MLCVHVFVHVLLPCAIPSLWMRKHRCTDGGHRWQRQSAAGRPRRVAVVVVLDDFMSTDIRERTIRNKGAFAQHWNYSLFAPSVAEVRRLAGGFAGAWAKLDVARQALMHNEYALVVDGDAVIMRKDIDLGLAIDEMELRGASLMISKDFNGLNSGVFLLKNSSWSLKFLHEAAAARPALGRQTRTMPLQYENRAFFYLLGMWPECLGLRRADALLAPSYARSYEFKSGVYVVDRCLINRRPEQSTRLVELLESNAAFDIAQGAFIMHVPGGNAHSKRLAMEQLLQQSALAMDLSKRE